jgi:hypothetical protein
MQGFSGYFRRSVYQKATGFCQKWELKNYLRQGGILHFLGFRIGLLRSEN